METPQIQNPIHFRNSETFLSPRNPETLLQGTKESLWLQLPQDRFESRPKEMNQGILGGAKVTPRYPVPAGLREGTQTPRCQRRAVPSRTDATLVTVTGGV